MNDIFLAGGEFGDGDGATECLFMGGNIASANPGDGSDWIINAGGGVMLLSTATVENDVNMVLNGGSFSIDDESGTGASATMDSLTLTADSSIGLDPSGTNSLTFTSIAASGTNGLSIYGWSDSSGNATGSQFLVTGDKSGIDLTQVWFEGFGYGATWNGNALEPTGAYVAPAIFGGHPCAVLAPIPEPSTWLSGGTVLMLVVWHEVGRRRRRLTGDQ